MDADRFDTFTRTLTAEPTRRAALRLLAGSVLAAGLARLGLAEAKDKKRNRRKKKRQAPCGSAGARCCKGGRCTAEHTFCLAGSCVCALTSLPRECGGQCISAQDCCVNNQLLRQGQIHRDCGVCTGREVLPTGPCGTVTTIACRTCNEETFFCRPANDGEPCAPGDAVCCEGDCCPTVECCPDGCCPGGKICCRGLECCPLDKCCGDGCCAANEVCCGVPGACLPACPPGQIRDPATCECLCGGQVCGNGETCIDELCRSQRCPAPNWYVCGATCCVPGYICCPDQPFCCDPGRQCNPTGGCRR